MGPVTVKPLSPLRQTIARRMAASWETVPRVTQFDDADGTRVTALRQQYKADYEQRGTRLTLTPFLVKAVAETLHKHPGSTPASMPRARTLCSSCMCTSAWPWTPRRA